MGKAIRLSFTQVVDIALNQLYQIINARISTCQGRQRLEQMRRSFPLYSLFLQSMISKEAFELVRRLGQLKSQENKEGKRVKGILQGMGEYETRVKKSLSQLQIKVNGLECELKMIRQHEKSEEFENIRKVDQVEESLKRLLESYQNEASNATKKLQSFIETAKLQIRTSYKEGIKEEKEQLVKFRQINSRLEEWIQNVRYRQKESIDGAQRVKQQIRQKRESLELIQCSQMEQINYITDRFFEKLADLEDKIQSQLNKIIQKKDLKIFEAEKTINGLIQKVAKNQ